LSSAGLYYGIDARLTPA